MYDMRRDRSRSPAGSMEARLTALEARVLDLEASIKQQRVCLKWWNSWWTKSGKWIQNFVCEYWMVEKAYHKVKVADAAVDDNSAGAVATASPADMPV